MTTPRRHRAPRSHALGRWNLRGLIAVLAALATVMAVGGVAFAYLTAVGTGTGTATTGTLNPPTAVSGSQVAHTSTVDVSWTAPSSGAAPTGYYVLRTPSPSGTTVAACGTSAAAPTVGTSCSDASVPNGDYTYVVVAAHHTWTATSGASAVVTVVETTQTITFTSSPSSPTVDGSYLVSADGGGSGNPVTFSSETPDVCTVVGSTVSFVGAGSCTIDADQAGNAQYNPAPQVQQIFTVAKAPQTISYLTTAPDDAVVGGPGYTPAASGGASGNAVILSIDGSTAANCSINAGVVTYQHVGTCTVNADQAGNADYLAAGTVQQSYGIGQGSQAIGFTSTAPLDAKVGGSTYEVTATGGPSGNAVTFSSGSPAVCAVAGSTVSFVGAGTCVVNADQAGNTDYLAAAQVQQTFAVTKNSQTITFTSTAPTGATYQGATYDVTATATSGLGVSLTVDGSSAGVCALSGSTVQFVGVGTCTINANQAGNGTYLAAPQVQQSFTVGKAAQTITFGSLADKTYGDASFTISATASSGLTVAFTSATTGVCTVSGSNVTLVGAGSCTINANQAGDANYNAASQVQQTFTVNKSNQTITFTQPASPATATTSDTLVFSASSGLPVTVTPTDATVCTVSGTTVNYLKSGTCTLTATQVGNANYNAATAVPRTVTVNTAPQTITFNQPTTPANAGTSASLVATASSGLTVAFTTPSAATICTITGGTTVNYVGAGNCVINANQAGNAVYGAATQVQRTVVVNPADTVAPTISSIMNNDADMSWTNNNNGGNSWNGGACGGNKLCATITDTGTPTSGVNAATITFSLVGLTGANAGKCFQSSTGTFVAGPCTITTSFASNVATATVPQNTNIMLNGTYTFTITVSDNAGNPRTTSVTLTIT